MTVGLFGGSFDPIHHGHLLAAQAVLEQLGLEAVRFVPAREQPFKRGLHAATAEQRAQMVSLAIDGIPAFSLERIELDRPGPSYTAETLRGLHAREPATAFALLIGADAAQDFPSWHEPGAVAGLARLVVFARPGAAPPNLPWPAEVVRVPAVDLSATAIRDRVAAGRSIRYWVPDRVADFIRSERLYLPDV